MLSPGPKLQRCISLEMVLITMHSICISPVQARIGVVPDMGATKSVIVPINYKEIVIFSVILAACLADLLF